MIIIYHKKTMTMMYDVIMMINTSSVFIFMDVSWIWKWVCPVDQVDAIDDLRYNNPKKETSEMDVGVLNSIIFSAI